MNNGQLINQDSGQTEWYTPWNIIECARQLMGSIDLDPFSCEKANQRPEGKLANMYFAVDDDPLNRPWAGNVWMNHPFGRKFNADAIGKLKFEHIKIGPTMQQACCITYASTSEKWFKPLLGYPQFYFTGRINYLDPDTLEPAKGVTKGSVITFLPPRGMGYQDALWRLNKIFSGKFEGVAK